MVFLVNSVYVKTVQKSPVFISERSLVLDADNYEWAFPLCECPVACSKLCGRVLSWVVVGTAGRPAFQVPTNKYLQRSPPTLVLTQGPHIPPFPGAAPLGTTGLEEQAGGPGTGRSAFGSRHLSTCMTLTLSAWFSSLERGY